MRAEGGLGSGAQLRTVYQTRFPWKVEAGSPTWREGECAQWESLGEERLAMVILEGRRAC